MNTDMNTVRLLGAAQVMVFVSFLIAGGFLWRTLIFSFWTMPV